MIIGSPSTYVAASQICSNKGRTLLTFTNKIAIELFKDWIFSTYKLSKGYLKIFCIVVHSFALLHSIVYYLSNVQ